MSGFAYNLERKAITKKDIPVFEVGDTVDVHVKIIEGDKHRIQIFTGVVTARKHAGLRETFTVRRIVAGEGVERIFPLHSPNIDKIEVSRRGEVRRAKLYYLRRRVGKATRIKEDLGRERGQKIDTRRTASIDKAAMDAEREAGEKKVTDEPVTAATAE